MIYKTNFIDELKSQWHLDRKMLIAESLGIIFGIIGSSIIMILQGDAPFQLAYGVFLVSSILLCGTSYYQKNSRLMFLNIIYLTINIMGLLLSA